MNTYLYYFPLSLYRLQYTKCVCTCSVSCT